MAEKDSAAISPESADYLEDVKKGKPRKFAMICKGTSVLSLVVYKKGNIENRKKEAKEGGKGQFYFGVVDGKGMDIRFVLARADGFESEPVKSTVLKSFLDEAAGMKCKPHFEIVDEQPLVLDEDDALVARFLKLREAALVTRDSYPDRAAEINTLCKQIGGYLNQDQAEQAEPKILELESLLGGLSQAQAPSNDTSLEAKLAEALKKFKPLLEKAIELHPNRKAELIEAFGNVRDEIKARQYDQAQAGVVALGRLLQSLVATTSEGPSSQPAQPPASSPNLQRPANAVSLVALGKARLEWDSVRQHAIGEFERLKGILKDEYEDFDDEQAALEAAVQRLNSMIATLNEELGDRLDTVLNSDPGQRPTLTGAAKSVLERFTSFVDADEILAGIDGNEYAPDMQVAAPMRSTLQKIASALG